MLPPPIVGQMTQQIARTVERRINESGLLLANEWVACVQTGDTWTVELWDSTGGCIGRGWICASPEEWTAFATMRHERRIGAMYGARHTPYAACSCY